MKFLVIRFSSIGDIVLTTPAIRCLKKTYPEAQVHFVTKKKFKDVSVHNKWIDKFFYYDNNMKELKASLKAENYSYIIDLHKNFRSYSIRSSLNVPTLSYDKESYEKLLLTKFHINKMSGKHISQRCLDAVKSLGVKDDGLGLDYFVSPNDEVTLNDLPPSHATGFIAIVIGASYFTKKLPVNKLQELCAQIQHPVILIGGKEDATEGAAIAAIDTNKIFNACGRFSLNQSASVIQKAKLVISHDTGMQYIACAYQKPVVAVWGGTSPKLDVEPYYGTANQPKYFNSIVPGLSCQPCSNFGKTKCPLGHFNCMNQQDIASIIAFAEKLLLSD